MTTPGSELPHERRAVVSRVVRGRDQGGGRKPPYSDYQHLIRHITGDARFYSGFGENFLESKSPFPGIQGGYVLKKVLELGRWFG